MQQITKGLWSMIRRGLDSPLGIELEIMRVELLGEEAHLVGEIAVKAARHAVVDLELELLYGELREIERERCVCCNSLARFHQSQAATIFPGRSQRISFDVSLPVRASELLVANIAEREAGRLYVLVSLSGPLVPPGIVACAELPKPAQVP